MDTFGQRLKKARQASGLTQVELASKVGAYQSKYKNWETDINEPDIQTINKLADTLGVSADWLLGRDEPPAKPYPKEFDREMFLLREEIKPYGPERVKWLRKMLPLLLDKEDKKLIAKYEKIVVEKNPQTQTFLKQHAKKGGKS
jgi:transcriptional regulator with XRE-family HTH domain